MVQGVEKGILRMLLRGQARKFIEIGIPGGQDEMGDTPFAEQSLGEVRRGSADNACGGGKAFLVFPAWRPEPA